MSKEVYLCQECGSACKIRKNVLIHEVARSWDGDSVDVLYCKNQKCKESHRMTSYMKEDVECIDAAKNLYKVINENYKGVD